MNREIMRRLARLESEPESRRTHYVVSDRQLSDEEWQASLDGEFVDESEGLSPLLTEAEWVAQYCFGQN